jgi:hypothetical protein
VMYAARGSRFILKAQQEVGVIQGQWRVASDK